VDVCVEGVGHIVVKHVRDAVNVDAACGDVSCDQDTERAVLKSAKRLRALALREVSMKRCGIDALLFKPLADPLGGVLHLRKHDRESVRISREPVTQVVELVLVLHGVHGVRNRCHGGLGLYLNNRWVLQDLLGEHLYLVRHSSREEKGLPLNRQSAHDLLNVGKESHVEHAVGLIQNEHLDL
jgi:hypothetical protein